MAFDGYGWAGRARVGGPETLIVLKENETHAEYKFTNRLINEPNRARIDVNDSSQISINLSKEMKKEKNTFWEITAAVTVSGSTRSMVLTGPDDATVSCTRK